jgi:hypothetical protein
MAVLGRTAPITPVNSRMKRIKEPVLVSFLVFLLLCFFVADL